MLLNITSVSQCIIIAYRAATQYMIGYYDHDNVVCLSVCLSVTMCIVALRVSV